MNDQKTCKYSTTRVADRECSDCRAGLCSSCGTELESIIENNGFMAPDPTHYEIIGYRPCQECKGVDYD